MTDGLDNDRWCLSAHAVGGFTSLIGPNGVAKAPVVRLSLAALGPGVDPTPARILGGGDLSSFLLTPEIARAVAAEIQAALQRLEPPQRG